MSADEPFRTVLAAAMVLLFPVALFYRIRSQATRERLDRRQEGLFILATLRPIGLATLAALITYLINPAAMAWASFPLPRALRWCGVGIAIAGSALFIWTMHHIGRNITDTVVTREKHALVTSGPYHRVRHPFYVGATLLILGNGLGAANWFILAGGAMAVTLLVMRLRIEEQKLVERFGDEYRDYMKRTRRFVPW
jgi:protein-S-isoprenylcysteine O-methyltransferase Ste14